MTTRLISDGQFNFFWKEYNKMPSYKSLLGTPDYSICMTEKYNTCYESSLSEVKKCYS